MSRPAESLRHPLARTLLVLTFTTGLVDAVCYLSLGRVFAANMTGNIVLLGFGLAGSGGLPVVAPLVSLAGFLVGAGAGGAAVEARTGVAAGRRHRGRRAHVARLRADGSAGALSGPLSVESRYGRRGVG